MKFQHLQKVEIIGGFYEGLFGIITNSRNNGVQEYFVETNTARMGQSWVRPSVWIAEKDLKENYGN